MTYYNEFDPKAAAWLRQLIADGLIPDGVVDERSIKDVQAHEIRRYRQAHFFAGIGGWAAALALSGWTGPIWTGSCPCQPFSVAGKGEGFADDRHLWPEFHRLIKECQPPTVVGEQVASPDGLDWLDVVLTDLEGEGYETGAADLCAAGIGAPHIRQRLFWVAHSNNPGSQGRAGVPERSSECPAGSGGVVGGMGISNSGGRPRGVSSTEAARHRCSPVAAGGTDRPRPTNSFWGNPDWLLCRDGKWRPVESGAQPLAHGVPNRVELLRGYGNAIVPQVAAEFLKAVIEWNNL